MKEAVNFSRFCDAFQIRKDSFTYEGKRALFDYLEEFEEGTGEEIELDVIELCCEYTEYESLAELQESYTDIKSIEDLGDHTTVIMVGDASFIIQNY